MSNFCKSVLLVIGLSFASPVFAQQGDEVTYSNGKILLQQQRYEQAMAEFMPLTIANSPYAPEASYFYSLAAFKAQKYKEAQEMLQQLKMQHPDWPQMPDATYLLANVLFERNNYEEAITQLQQLNNTPLATDAAALERYYLVKLADKAAFEKLVQRHPNDKVLAQVYADKLVNGWYRQEDKNTLERLVSKHNLDRNKYLNAAARRQQGFDVALLLPFQLNQDLNQNARKNQFVNDLYAGMQLAQDSLEEQGVKLNLYAYDAGADTAKVSRIFQLPEVRQMDLVIGPVYKSGATIANRFARTTGTTVINPLSQDLEVAGPNSNVFLFESSVATQARQAATYAYNTFSPKTAVILFENTKDDTTFAYFYKDQFKKLGGKVKTYKKISSSQASATASVFNNLNLTDVGHMAVFSDKMTAAVNATSKLQASAATLPLITYNNWLNINQISLRQLDNLEVYFISPKYVDTTSPAVKSFREKYIQRYNVPPSVYAYAGFEMLYFYGSMLQQYGPNLTQALLENGISRGALYPAVGYTNKTTRVELRSDNQFVPIIKLENLQPIVVNTVY
ncbi:ABC transporter substrate-binding protein [Pontibacter sp. Tf4]|uniref:ABC transporter substrate-binding protein n=1 Tax=Pontibacter sp. Tf4 TaxID=2761620 RepID=UPI0016292349|nr:ABC transporter substrate-binding protein [Pontibacter sp. Tf4]MBB6610444.1 ABC transporter substrate-binding protein [Pontibacter sp. Tf4]